MKHIPFLSFNKTKSSCVAREIDSRCVREIQVLSADEIMAVAGGPQIKNAPDRPPVAPESATAV